jgi:hypothetical protein
LLELNNSLKDSAETSFPKREVRLANSNTGLDSDIIDLDKLIEIPICLQKDWYRLAISLSKRTKSSPRMTY